MWEVRRRGYWVCRCLRKNSRCESSPTSTVCAEQTTMQHLLMPALLPPFLILGSKLTFSPADAFLLNYDRRGKKPSKDGWINEGMATNAMNRLYSNIMQQHSCKSWNFLQQMPTFYCLWSSLSFISVGAMVSNFPLIFQCSAKMVS